MVQNRSNLAAQHRKSLFCEELATAEHRQVRHSALTRRSASVIVTKQLVSTCTACNHIVFYALKPSKTRYWAPRVAMSLVTAKQQTVLLQEWRHCCFLLTENSSGT
jgi:hypothetical protein